MRAEGCSAAWLVVKAARLCPYASTHIAEDRNPVKGSSDSFRGAGCQGTAALEVGTVP